MRRVSRQGLDLPRQSLAVRVLRVDAGEDLEGQVGVVASARRR